MHILDVKVRVQRAWAGRRILAPVHQGSQRLGGGTISPENQLNGGLFAAGVHEADAEPGSGCQPDAAVRPRGLAQRRHVRGPLRPFLHYDPDDLVALASRVGVHGIEADNLPCCYGAAAGRRVWPHISCSSRL